MDHEEEGFPDECTILFVSESFKMEFGELTPFTQKEEALIEQALEKSGHKNLIGLTEYTAAVKCPSVKDKDMSKDDKDICRQHIAKTIEKCKPKLIFVCGNLPMVMLTKKSGIMTKRGKIVAEYEGIPVVAIYHPTQVIVEPQNEYLFCLDIQNAIEQVLIKENTNSEFEWNMIDTLDKLHSLDAYTLFDVAIDIETTGLDFLKDKIQTLALSFDANGKQKTVVIPIYHKEFQNLDVASGWVPEVIKFLNKVFQTPSLKILHKAQFDLKFLTQLGVEVQGTICDTKIMQHLIDENLPKSLKDLVGYYFPSEQGII
jgi:uracil-DNA glycosylase family 4